MSFKFENSDYEVEMDNKVFFTSPRKLFILFYIFILIAIIVVGIQSIDYMHYSKNPDIPKMIKSYERPNEHSDLIAKAMIATSEASSEVSSAITSYVQTLSDDNSSDASQFKNISADLNLSLATLASNDYWMTDLDIFKSVLKGNINGSGFKANVNYMSEEQWISLHAYLNTVFS